RVPDHGKLSPWRFIVIAGDARAQLGQVLAAAFRDDQPGAAPEVLAFEAGRFERAPVTVAVVSTAQPDHAKIPEWEQILSSGAACQTMLIAANAMGYAAQWLTEWYAYDARVADALGLSAHERVAGFIYIGSPGAEPLERARPDVEALTTHWSAEG
ncbi:MAG: nitroreductase, partial [Pseudomonadota bacterium]